MLKKCCQAECVKIKPKAYSGTPNHKIGNIPADVGTLEEDVYENEGEAYPGVEYSSRTDNVYSYKVTGDETNVYHCCGSDGIHVYPLDSFYSNGNLNSRWKIGSAAEMGLDTSNQTFYYAHSANGKKLTGVLNRGESFRYGYEPTNFSGFYDCFVDGRYLVAARGVDGISIYKFNESKTSATLLKNITVPSGVFSGTVHEKTVVKTVRCTSWNGYIIILAGVAGYEKPTVPSGVDFGAYDMPAAPVHDWDSPVDPEGWAGVAEYEYAIKRGYSNEVTDGFSTIKSYTGVKLHCVAFDTKREKKNAEDSNESGFIESSEFQIEGNWVLKENLELKKEVAGSFSDLESKSATFAPADEITDISFKWGEGTESGDKTINKLNVRYGYATYPAVGSVVPALGGVRKCTFNLEFEKKTAENIGSGEEDGKVRILNIGVEEHSSVDTSHAVLSIEDRADATFISRFWDGYFWEAGAQSQGTNADGGLKVIAHDGSFTENYIFSELSMELFYKGGGYFTTYNLVNTIKADLYDATYSNKSLILSLYEGGLLVACQEDEGTVGDWEGLDERSQTATAAEIASGGFIISSLGKKMEAWPTESFGSTLNIIDSWTDGKTIFSVDCLQSSVLGGPRRLGLYYFPSGEADEGSPEVNDLKRSYLYRTDDNDNGVMGGGLIAFSKEGN